MAVGQLFIAIAVTVIINIGKRLIHPIPVSVMSLTIISFSLRFAVIVLQLKC